MADVDELKTMVTEPSSEALLQRVRGAVGGTSMDVLCVNTIRTLSIDAVQRANSGHPGTPMAMAPVAYTLWQRFLRFDRTDLAEPRPFCSLGWARLDLAVLDAVPD